MVSLSAEDTMHDALKAFQEERVHQIPVFDQFVNGGRVFYGMLTIRECAAFFLRFAHGWTDPYSERLRFKSQRRTRIRYAMSPRAE
jgi:CBS-domain-containing membrane protein